MIYSKSSNIKFHPRNFTAFYNNHTFRSIYVLRKRERRLFRSNTANRFGKQTSFARGRYFKERSQVDRWRKEITKEGQQAKNRKNREIFQFSRMFDERERQNRRGRESPGWYVRIESGLLSR